MDFKRYPKCSCVNCEVTLQSKDEIVMGLCADHRNLLERNDHYVGICNECSCITGVGRKPRYARDMEKYLLSKDCPKCNAGSNGINWCTVPKGNVTKANYDEDNGIQLESYISESGNLVIRNRLLINQNGRIKQPKNS